MAELLQAISKTAYPDGKIQIYEFGMMPNYRSIEGINNWYKWLHKHVFSSDRKRRGK